MTTTAQRLAEYDRIRRIESVDEIDARLDRISEGKASSGRPYPDEVRWLCRQRIKLTRGAE